MHKEHNCRNYDCELTRVNPQTFKPHSASLALRMSRVSNFFWVCVWRTTCSSHYTHLYSRRLTNPGVTKTFYSSIHDWSARTDFLLQNNPRLWLKPWIVEFHLLTCLCYSIYRVNLNVLGNLSARKEIFDEIKLCCHFLRNEAVELHALIATMEKTRLNFLPQFIVQKRSKLWSRLLRMCLPHGRSNLCRVRVCIRALP